MAKFCICKTCGNLIGIINDAGVVPSCCGQEMIVLTPNTVDASGEKHLPVVTVEADDRGMRVIVNVGNVAHPMTEAHLINWIFVETNKGGHRCALSASDKPQAVFNMAADEIPVAVYAYCNLHGLWKTAL